MKKERLFIAFINLKEKKLFGNWTNIKQSFYVGDNMTRDEALKEIEISLTDAFNIANNQNCITFEEYTTLKTFIVYFAKLLGIKNILEEEDD